MKLAEIAATDVIFVSPSDTADTAIALMEEHEIHHLPVVGDGRTVGIVSDRDLLQSVGWMAAVDRVDLHDGVIVGPRFVSDIMSSPVQTLHPDDRVVDAARMMLREQIGAVELLSDGQLVGLVAESDVLRCFTDHRLQFESSRWRFQKVVDYMSARVFTLNHNAPIIRATRLMKDKGVRHVPLLDGDNLVGVVSDRDIRKACFREHVEWLRDDARRLRTRTRLHDVMSPKPLRVGPETTLADAASRLVEARIGALPVATNRRLCGIITETDLLHAFVHASDAA